MVDLVEITLMAIAYIAMFNCILRSDYNIVVALVCFFYWSTRFSKAKRVANIIYIILILVTIFDIVWLILVWKSWTTTDSLSLVWRKLRFLHITVLTLTIVNMVLKIVACVLIFLNVRKE